VAAALSPDGTPEALLDLATGRLPASAGQGAALAARTRAGGSAESPQFEIALAPPGSGRLQVWMADAVVSRLEWWVGDELRAEVRYDRYVPVGAARLPSRLELRAPKARLRARLELEQFELRQGFTPGSFDVGRTGNPGRDRCVSRG
jgi:hypothetical protein